MKNLIICVVLLAVGGYLYASWQIQRDVAKGVDMAVIAMSPYAVVEYEGVSATLTGELTVDGIRARVRGFDDDIYIDRIGIDTPSFLTLMKFGDIPKLVASGDDFLPEYFGLMIEGWRMPVDADYGYKLHAERIAELGVDDAEEVGNECTGKYGLPPAALIAMGYEEYDISMSAQIRKRDSDYAVDIVSNMDDMWKVDAELILVGDMMTELAKGNRYRPKMSQMRIEYTNLSTIERMGAYCKQRGLTDDQIHTAMVESFQFLGEDNGAEFDEFILEPFVEFLSGGKTFVITANPRDPINLSQISLYSPKDVPALLRLKAEVH
jgi:hypothetical protein